MSKITPDEYYVIKGKIRQAFRQSERFKACLIAARVELPPAIKKDGTPGKRNQVRYKCAHCGGLFQQANVSVDHIRPVVPFWAKEPNISIATIIDNIYCDLSNLQILCSTPMKNLPKGQRSCHAIKTQRENFIRNKFYENDIQPLSDKIIEAIETFSKEYDTYLLDKKKKEEEKAERKRLKTLNKKSKKE